MNEAVPYTAHIVYTTDNIGHIETVRTLAVARKADGHPIERIIKYLNVRERE